MDVSNPIRTQNITTEKSARAAMDVARDPDVNAEGVPNSIAHIVQGARRVEQPHHQELPQQQQEQTLLQCVLKAGW